MNTDNYHKDYLEFKGMLCEIKEKLKMLDLLIPAKVAISFLAETVGKTRQAIRQFLIRHYEPEEDYWLEGGKMYSSRKAAMDILSRRKKGD